MLSGPVSGATPISPQNGASGHVDPRPELGPAGRPGHGRDLVERGGEVVGQQPEAGDAGGPAPVAGRQLEDVDLERVARLGAGDLDRAVDLVDPVEVERLEVGRRRVGRQLSVRRIEAVEPDDVARRHRRDRRDRRVPGEVGRVARDMDGRRVEHGRCLLRGAWRLAVTREPPFSAEVRPAWPASWSASGVASSVSPIASRTELSLSRSREPEVEPDDDADEHPDRRPAAARTSTARPAAPA